MLGSRFVRAGETPRVARIASGESGRPARSGSHRARIKSIEIDNQFLGALDCKGRNKHCARRRVSIAHFGGKVWRALRRRRRRADRRRHRSILKSHSRGPSGASGSRLQQLGVGTNIAGSKNKQRLPGNSFIGKLEFNGRGAEQMACIPIAGPHAGHDLKPRLVFDRLESVERGNSVGLRCKSD